MRESLIHLIIIVLLLIEVSCTNSLNNPVSPKVLRFGVSTRDEDPEQARNRMDGMKRYLENELGIEVKIYETSGYAEVIEALKTNKLDISSVGSFTYILASDNAGVEAISCRGTLDGRIEPYHSLIITRKGSDIKSMQDVIQNASRLTFAYTDPASTSGHLIPRAYLESIGLKNDKFKQVFFSGSHTTSFFTVRAGKTDIGCISESTINKLTKEGKIKRDEFVVLWKSDPIINSAVCVRKALDTGFKFKLQQALVNFRMKDPENWKKYASLMAKETILPYDSLCFISANDSMYNDLRQIAQRYTKYRKSP